MRNLVLLVALGLVGPALAQELNDESFDRWLAAIVPAPQELAFREIPWRPTFWDGVREAQEQDKPILLWAMNGHPLGCT